MKNTQSSGAPAIAHEKIERISINQRAGVWRVAVNGGFYGDYVRRDWALEAALDRADEVAAAGAGATIIWTIEGEQDRLLYETARPVRRDEVERAMARKQNKSTPKWPHTRRWPPIVGEAFAKRLLEQARG